jgi:hypothetical protein
VTIEAAIGGLAAAGIRWRVLLPAIETYGPAAVNGHLFPSLQGTGMRVNR